MPVAAEMPRSRKETWEGIENWARRRTEEWCEMCDAFKAKTQGTMLARDSSVQELEQHRAEMRTFLRLTRLLQAEVADPDFPDRTLAESLGIRLGQLEHLWEMIHNPMADDEADKLLGQAFPG